MIKEKFGFYTSKKELSSNTIDSDSTADEPNQVTDAAIKSAKKGEELYGPFDSIEDLMKALND